MAMHDIAVDLIPVEAQSSLGDTPIDFIPNESQAFEESQFYYLTAGTGPLLIEAFASDIPSIFSTGSLFAEVYVELAVPPAAGTGPLRTEVYAELAVPPVAGTGPLFSGEVLAAPPPLPPPPTPSTRAPSLAPDALVRQYSLAISDSVTIQGGPQLTDAYTALNALTPAQYAFLARRQLGADGALPQTRVGRFTGPAYPFGPSWALTLGPKTDLEVIFTSICNIITTVLGTLPYAPLRGSEVPNLVFEPNDPVTQGLIRYFVRRELGRQEPRAKILAVRTVVPANDPYRITVTAAFQIVGDPDGRVFSAPVEYNTLGLAV